MQPARPYRPKVSRETRLLLTAAALALAVLWLLARIRFQGLPATPNPIPAVLSQLSSSPRYDDLAGQLAQIQSRLQSSLLLLDATTPSRRVAIKLRDDLVVTWAPFGSEPGQGTTLLAHDPASGLAVASSMTASAMPLPLPWTPRRLQQPRYFFAARAAGAGVGLYPVFIGSLAAIGTPLWTGDVWTAPPGTTLVAGEFLFSTEAELAGLVVADGSDTVIMPVSMLLAEAERLLSSPPRSGGTVGIEVQALTPPVAAVANATTGVVVTAVEPAGPAADGVQAGDVIEAADGLALTTVHHWRVLLARLAPGQALALRVRRGGEPRDVTLVAAPPPGVPVSAELGLVLRGRARVGAEVMRLERGSVGARAGLAVGDVITLIAGTPAPSPAQVLRAFSAAGESRRVLVAITRGDRHFVTVLGR